MAEEQYAAANAEQQKGEMGYWWLAT